jgi:hypothetical protein
MARETSQFQVVNLYKHRKETTKCIQKLAEMYFVITQKISSLELLLIC